MSSPKTLLLVHLTHTGMGRSVEAVPLGIGYVATYLAKFFPASSFKIEIVTLPEELERRIIQQDFDLVGFSNFMWNCKLNEFYAEKISSLTDVEFVFFGGQEFPSGNAEMASWMQERPYIDFFVKDEGEVGCVNLFSRYFECNGILSDMKSAPIDGVVFLDDQERLVRSIDVYVRDLSELPSPTLAGLFDEEIAAGVIPMLEFARGCPYTCAYCKQGNINVKVRSYPTEVYVNEIRYLEERVPKGSHQLIVSDSNFAMHPGHDEVCDVLQEAIERSSWPGYINAATGRSYSRRVIKNLAKLGKNRVHATLSLESGNEETLKIIHRKNASIERISNINEELKSVGIESFCHFVIPMPSETFESLENSYKEIMNMGIAVGFNTLQQLTGVETASKECVEKYEMKEMYRILYRSVGKYFDTPVFEVERLCVATKDFSFDDYLAIRVIGYLSTLMTHSFFSEFTFFLRMCNLKTYDWIKFIYEKSMVEENELKPVIAEFRKDAEDELWDSEEALIAFFSQEENYNAILKGEMGYNLVTTYVAKALSSAFHTIVDLSVQGLKSQLDSKNCDTQTMYEQLDDIAEYIRLKYADVFGTTEGEFVEQFRYDVDAWVRSHYVDALEKFPAGAGTYTFIKDKDRIAEVKLALDRYGDTFEGKGRIFRRLNRDVLARKVRESPENANGTPPGSHWLHIS